MSIRITEVHFDTALMEGSHNRQIVGIKAIAWYRDGVHFRAFHESQIDSNVRVELALIVAPSLKTLVKGDDHHG